MTIVADAYDFVVGVDTHARTHTYAILNTHTGTVVATDIFPTSQAGMKRALTWVTRHSDGSTLTVIECIGSYGAKIASLVAEMGYAVVEPFPTTAKARAGRGKSDPVDAELIARSVIGIDTVRLRRPRDGHGERAALRVLVTARENMTREHTAAINTLTALTRITDLGIDTRKPLSGSQITLIASWRTREESIELTITRGEAIRLAKRIQTLDAELVANQAMMVELIHRTPAAGLLAKTGIGPVTAAIIYTTWSHPGRVRSEAAFASLTGVNPIPASSGNTIRYRLNRGGDRRLNRALYMATLTRMTYDPATRDYANKRRAEGKTDREIRRILKRYLARQIYRYLYAATTPTAAI